MFLVIYIYIILTKNYNKTRADYSTDINLFKITKEFFAKNSFCSGVNITNIISFINELLFAMFLI